MLQLLPGLELRRAAAPRPSKMYVMSLGSPYHTTSDFKMSERIEGDDPRPTSGRVKFDFTPTTSTELEVKEGVNVVVMCKGIIEGLICIAGYSYVLRRSTIFLILSKPDYLY